MNEPRWRVVVALGLLLTLTGCSVATRVDSAPATVVFLVRHAEKQSGPDPGLSEAGVVRAERLARLLQDSGVTHLISTEHRRTGLTLEPLARRMAIDVQSFPARSGDSTLQAIRELPAGSVAVVAGHSNTVPALVRGLGGTIDSLDPEADLDESDYDRLFVVVMSRGSDSVGRTRVTTLELRF